MQRKRIRRGFGFVMALVMALTFFHGNGMQVSAAEAKDHYRNVWDSSKVDTEYFKGFQNMTVDICYVENADGSDYFPADTYFTVSAQGFNFDDYTTYPEGYMDSAVGSNVAFGFFVETAPGKPAYHTYVMFIPQKTVESLAANTGKDVQSALKTELSMFASFAVNPYMGNGVPEPEYARTAANPYYIKTAPCKNGGVVPVVTPELLSFVKQHGKGVLSVGVCYDFDDFGQPAITPYIYFTDIDAGNFASAAAPASEQPAATAPAGQTIPAAPAATVPVMASGAPNVIVIPTLNWQDIFDADYYLRTYPDLKAAGVTSKELLFQHFMMFGMWEQRKPNASFDLKTYMKYADLQAAFGDQYPLYYQHYIMFGKAEGRRIK
ncbi:MAG: hypothetical protein IJR00_01145 [Lachnospiraceae bacterium]|nr:hypothetical protein [Lachnospiraceae bacterium]